MTIINQRYKPSPATSSPQRMLNGSVIDCSQIFLHQQANWNIFTDELNYFSSLDFSRITFCNVSSQANIVARTKERADRPVRVTKHFMLSLKLPTTETLRHSNPPIIVCCLPSLSPSLFLQPANIFATGRRNLVRCFHAYFLHCKSLLQAIFFWWFNSVNVLNLWWNIFTG